MRYKGTLCLGVWVGVFALGFCFCDLIKRCFALCLPLGGLV